jgi:molybdenum cofactor guanylyltransferase
MSARLAVVVLAGGDGRRMGGSKPLRVLAGRTLIERAVEQARLWSDLVAVSVREKGQAGPVAVPEIFDAEGEGPIAGLAAALRFASDNGAGQLLTIACDMPVLPPNLPDRLTAALTPRRGAVLTSSGGALHPVCALWRTSALAALPAYRASGRSSLKGFAETLGYAVGEWPVEPHDPFLNVNRPEELEAAERLLATL